MFNNFINIYDFFRIIEKIKAGVFLQFIKKLIGTSTNRVKASWNNTVSPPIQFWDIPYYQAYLNQLISGHRFTSHRHYIKNKYFPKASDLVALSPGCGTGHNEVEWAGLNIFKRIDAFDISETRIRYAIENSKKKGWADILNFFVADCSDFPMGENVYDLIIFEGSLHHFSRLRLLLSKVGKALKTDGFLLVKDYVGPSRFQWQQRQLEITNALLTLIPDKYKKKWHINTIKKRVFRPSRLSMIISDPSEAVESENILPILKELCHMVEFKKLGGTILQLLLGDIAHNFLGDDPETTKWLDLCFYIEEFMLNQREISSDLIMAMYQKK